MKSSGDMLSMRYLQDIPSNCQQEVAPMGLGQNFEIRKFEDELVIENKR